MMDQKPITGKDVVQAARKYVGVSLVQGGRDREYGLDCVGLILATGKDLGLLAADLDIVGYGLNLRRHPKAAETRALLKQVLRQVHPDGAVSVSDILGHAQLGDVLYFQVRGIALTLGIVSKIGPAARPTPAIMASISTLAHFAELMPSERMFSGSATLAEFYPVKKVIGGIAPEVHGTLDEYSLDIRWGCSLAGCYRFDGVSEA
jgi:hypothetical protein